MVIILMIFVATIIAIVIIIIMNLNFHLVIAKDEIVPFVISFINMTKFMVVKITFFIYYLYCCLSSLNKNYCCSYDCVYLTKTFAKKRCTNQGRTAYWNFSI